MWRENGQLLPLIDGHKELFRGGNLYCQYLNCLAALLDKPEPDAPAFMSSPAWQIKSCQTALAGWAQLRHTWSLQAKESASYGAEIESPAGFVEPVPEFFARMAQLAGSCERGFQEQGVLEYSPAVLAGKIRVLLAMAKANTPPKECSSRQGQDVGAAMDLVRVCTTRPEKIPADFSWDQSFTWAQVPANAATLERLADGLDRGQVKLSLDQVSGLGQESLQPAWRNLGQMCLKLDWRSASPGLGRSMCSIQPRAARSWPTTNSPARIA
jgi:hypothetical protein